MSGVVTEQFFYGRRVQVVGVQVVPSSCARQFVLIMVDVVMFDVSLKPKTSRCYSQYIGRLQHQTNKVRIIRDDVILGLYLWL